MPHLSDLSVDRVSFWLGFLAATIFWWLFGRFRKVFPILWARFRETLEKIRQERLAGIEGQLRKETIRRVQQLHIASALFSLDEVLIEPLLLAPPTNLESSSADQQISIAKQVIPCLPDWPEILAPFRVSVFTPQQAIQYGRNIAIIGQPGSGKTTVLARLACAIARQEDGKLPGALPIFLHAFDLDFGQEPTAIEDPLDLIQKDLVNRLSGVQNAQLTQFFKAVTRDKQRKIVLMLDGLDELPPERLKACVTFLASLHKAYPRFQTIVTAPSNYLDGLTQAGFYPLGVAAWTQAQRAEFTARWGELWNKLLVPEFKENYHYPEIDPAMYTSWLSDEAGYLSPLELTLRIWGAFAGDLSGCNPMSVIETHIARFLPDPSYFQALEEIALNIIASDSIGMNFDEVEKILSRFKPQKSNTRNVPDNSGENTTEGEKNTFIKARRSLTVSAGEKIIDDLIAGGIFVEHSGGMISFTNPVFLGFLAGRKTSEEEIEHLIRNLNWSAAVETLHFASSFQENSAWVSKLIEDPAPPLYQNLFIVSRWLRDAPVNAGWRSQLLRMLVTVLQNDTIPFSIRLRMVAAFYLSRDPSTPKLFKQLLSSRSPILRRAALIGCGTLGSPQMINDILGLLADGDEYVRSTACLALSAIPSEMTMKAIAEVLLSGDEEIRQAAAESLVLIPNEGHNVLEEAAFIEDLLARRAAVFGLMQIQEPWAKRTLEKMAVEDSQWVVRNAAAQALESIQQVHLTIPRPLPPPHEAPWLITFASNLGMGIQPGSDAIDVLKTALNSGSTEEQIAALNYLANHPSEDVISLIYKLLYGNREALHEPALYALWWISLSGFPLPEPAQFGLGITGF